MPRHVSSWIPAACGETTGSDEWVQFSRGGKPFFWNRRSHETFWTPPEGVKVVWIGEPAAGGFGIGTRKRVSVLMISHRFLLTDWFRVPLLADLLGVYVLPETYSFGFFWSGYASVLCVFRQRMQFMCQSSVALVVISHMFVCRCTSDP